MSNVYIFLGTRLSFMTTQSTILRVSRAFSLIWLTKSSDRMIDWSYSEQNSSSLDTIYASGDTYIASILNSEPMAPSMAHPA